jgi:flagellar biosynthesis protein FlhB
MSELPPSEKRRREARRAGRVAVSPLAVAAGALSGAVLAAYATRGALGEAIGGFARAAFSGALPVENALLVARQILVRALLPILLAASAGAVVVGLVQTRALFSLGAFAARRREDEPRFLIGWATAAVLAAMLLSGAREFLGALARVSTPLGGARVVAVAAGALVPRALALLAVAAAAEWMLRWQRLEQALRMTRAERRAEERAEEGDPRLRAERRRRHRALSGRSLLDELGRAQRVVTSADRAFALRDEDGDPQIVIAAEGLEAARLVDAARRLGLPVRADDAGLLRARRR